ncbi:unnamed protein product, partial [Discosporangium mesarthrocarpum]
CTVQNREQTKQMNFGAKGRALLVELKRSDWLPPYSEDGVRGVLAEIQALWDELEDTLGGKSTDEVPDPVKVSLVVHHQAILRNKRCLLAYVNWRSARIAQLRWETGPVVPQELQSSLSPREMELFNSYDRLLTNYMQQEFGLDLTADLQPPKELHVEVRVLQDCGEIMTDQGPVKLERGTTHLLRRSDVEHLVRQGFLLELENEST